MQAVNPMLEIADAMAEYGGETLNVARISVVPKDSIWERMTSPAASTQPLPLEE